MAKVDLNLIVIFDAIMREQSITIAAEQLAMTQPSVSKAVSRMRCAWRDPLFLKQGRGITPTPYARKLWHEIADPLRQINSSISPPKFDPMTSSTQLRVALTDGISGLFWPKLRAIVEQRAHAIDLYAVPFQGNGEQLLLNAEVDLVLDYFPTKHQHITVKHLYENNFTCVMHPNHPLASQDLSLEAFCRADHLLVSLSGDPSGAVDKCLMQEGMQRRVAMTVNSFSSAIDLLQESNLICVMPFTVASKAIRKGQLVHKAVPISVPSPRISVAWHTRNRPSLALKWLINEIEQLVIHDSKIFTAPLLQVSLSAGSNLGSHCHLNEQRPI
ncbi:LysR family transcriptional regulator [Vibrio europaeus]|uniref:LysR family transcriptional regulator n=1 Tax=Vibrio europaeus TaxID=300876 RepID=A0AAE7AXJ2_9VIBR|nr:LysR family transcriptional regulator [Vibrio europaeus]MDC5705772.1 LysR family transcriptional regulator [Vibrio europaeus]MDC5709182.1 LysR family transcriptional regulator [Vibrio europaeus]MDC5713581.1 LysR family transcriptional regulator [Vibrio europaeus]MDC5720301.1 LysR family transcriptional regulator [Vibrio europaeus]MDC5723812.1 LysR family transcriptional regulator [Vibrio europaeus]